MNDTPTPRTDEALCRDFTPSPRAIGWTNGRKAEWMANDIVTADFARSLERELAAVTEQRDEARSQAEHVMTLHHLEIGMLELKDKATTEQRDRLAEALRNVMKSGDSTTMYRTAKKALQSLMEH